jgi:hypothetical protein
MLGDLMRQVLASEYFAHQVTQHAIASPWATMIVTVLPGAYVGSAPLNARRLQGSAFGACMRARASFSGMNVRHFKGVTTIGVPLLDSPAA